MSLLSCRKSGGTAGTHAAVARDEKRQSASRAARYAIRTSDSAASAAACERGNGAARRARSTRFQERVARRLSAWGLAIMRGMPPLSAKERAQLPDSAFAYIDSRGRRRLPIHDAAHVRNALARFSQVAFEDEGARDRARSRLLRAAMKHGIMPDRLRQRAAATAAEAAEGPRHVPADRYRGLNRAARAPRRSIRRPARRCPPSGARRGAVMPAVARRPPAGTTSSRSSNAPRRRSRPRWRSSGRCTPAPGPAGSTCGCESACIAGVPRSPIPATSASRSTPPRASASRRTAARSSCPLPFARRSLESLPDGVSLRSLGAWRFRGLPEPMDLFQVDAADLPADFPPPRSATPAK